MTDTVHLVQTFDSPTTMCCQQPLRDLGDDDLITRLTGKVTCPIYQPVLRSWLVGGVVDGAALAHEVWALATRLGWQPEADTIVANVHELAGWLDACLDSAGLTGTHSHTWLTEWAEADRARRLSAARQGLQQPPTLVHGVMASRSWAADTTTDTPSTSDTQHYRTPSQGAADELVPSLLPFPIVLDTLTVVLAGDPDWADLSADRVRELAALLTGGLRRGGWAIVRASDPFLAAVQDALVPAATAPVTAPQVVVDAAPMLGQLLVDRVPHALIGEAPVDEVYGLARALAAAMDRHGLVLAPRVDGAGTLVVPHALELPVGVNTDACSGDAGCAAPVHVHGCYADEGPTALCDDPKGHGRPGLENGRHRDGCARWTRGDELWWDPRCGACVLAANVSMARWHAGLGRWVRITPPSPDQMTGGR